MSGWTKWNGPQAELKMRLASRAAVRDVAHAILEQAKTEVPHDEGTLERSGLVKVNPEGSPEAVISFGGGRGTGHPRIPYAVRWHENNARFQKGRKRFYLRDPLIRDGPKLMREAIKKEVEDRLK